MRRVTASSAVHASITFESGLFENFNNKQTEQSLILHNENDRGGCVRLNHEESSHAAIGCVRTYLRDDEVSRVS